MQVLALCGVCLLCTATLCWAESTPEPAKSGAELDKAIETNVEAQDYAEETTPVRAQIIKGEPAALISSGTGDISTTGALLQRHPLCWRLMRIEPSAPSHKSTAVHGSRQWHVE